MRRDADAVLIRLLTEVEGRSDMGTSEPMPAAQLLHYNRVLDDSWVNGLPRWNGGGWIYPANHLLKSDLREVFMYLIPNDGDFAECFHAFEYRIGLVQERTQRRA